MIKLSTLAAWLGTELDSDQPIKGFSTDSRKIQTGEVFIALTGEHFDGHAFVKQAAERGAIAALVEHRLAEVSIPQLVVEDSLKALGDIARQYRQQIHCPVIALTGSNGKTSVKEMIASILPQPAWATRGNLNNHIGVPLTVLQLQPEHRYAVLELGANHLGEIAYTVGIAQPQVALINNIAPAHIEGFGSIQGVAIAKGEIYQGLPAGGTAIVNDDDHYAHFWDESLPGKKVYRYSLQHQADFYASDIDYDEQGCARFRLHGLGQPLSIHLQVPGEHSIRNALAAAACCHAVGIDSQQIEAGLNRFAGVAGRLNFKRGLQAATIIDDTYNANLKSVLTALAVLAKRPGKTIFAFGDMGELGEHAEAHHREVGEAAKSLGISQLFTCGRFSQAASQAFGSGAAHFDSQDALIARLRPALDASTTVLVKGSRSSAMENVVNALLCD